MEKEKKKRYDVAPQGFPTQPTETLTKEKRKRKEKKHRTMR